MEKSNQRRKERVQHILKQLDDQGRQPSGEFMARIGLELGMSKVKIAEYFQQLNAGGLIKIEEGLVWSVKNE